MKSSIITSFAISMLTFMGTAEAYVTPELAPGIPRTFEEAQRQGASNTTYQDFVDAQKNCQDNHSGDEEAWRNCLTGAEHAYLSALGIAPTDRPTVGESMPVSTNAADSKYEQKAPDHKGYLNADE